MTEYNTREDGEGYKSTVAAETTCAYCGASITQRSEGRPRKFCDSTCRSGAHRGSSASRRIRGGYKRTSRT